jgi:CP family cyanate transporter-like MFS transporter
VAVLLVAFNLRTAVAAVAPVLPEVRADLGMSGPAAGLLTALPVICFAAATPAAAWLGQRLGLAAAILLSCLVIAAGSIGRVLGGTTALLIGTLVVGVAMTVGNVLVPVVAKRDFAHRVGAVTGLYTAALIAGAAAAAALTAPVSATSDWRFGLAAWAVPAGVAAIMWMRAAGWRREDTTSASTSLAGGRAVWRSGVAWAVALLLGAQAAAYYAVTAWLPTLLRDRIGMSLEGAGLGMSVFQVLGIAGTLVISGLATVRQRQGWLAGLVAGGWAVLPAGLLAWPAGWPLWVVVGGIAQGAGITLALTLIALRAHSADIARDLSAMAQLIGYTIGAIGPLAVGLLYELTGAWTAPLVLLIVLAGCIALTGARAGRDVTVGAALP